MKELIEARIKQLESEHQRIKLTVASLEMGLQEAKDARTEVTYKLEEERQLLAAIGQKEASDAGAANDQEAQGQETSDGSGPVADGWSNGDAEASSKNT